MHAGNNRSAEGQSGDGTVAICQGVRSSSRTAYPVAAAPSFPNFSILDCRQDRWYRGFPAVLLQVKPPFGYAGLFSTFGTTVPTSSQLRTSRFFPFGKNGTGHLYPGLIPLATTCPGMASPPLNAAVHPFRSLILVGYFRFFCDCPSIVPMKWRNGCGFRKKIG